MGLQKNKHEQISVGHFGGKHAMANRYGTQKTKTNNFPEHYTEISAAEMNIFFVFHLFCTVVVP